MPRVSFMLKKMEPLIEDLKTASAFKPTLEQRFDAKYYKDGTQPTPADWPENSNDIDETKVPRGFWVVKDNGVYIMSNSTSAPKRENNYPLVVYANGYNPGINDDWYERAHSLGGDDFSVFIDFEWYETLMKTKPNAKVFALNFGANEISLVLE